VDCIARQRLSQPSTKLSFGDVKLVVCLLKFQNFVWAFGWSGRKGLDSAAVQMVEEN
jgi:hypothetical protein